MWNGELALLLIQLALQRAQALLCLDNLLLMSQACIMPAVCSALALCQMLSQPQACVLPAVCTELALCQLLLQFFQLFLQLLNLPCQPLAAAAASTVC